jgi:hypothetical protein
LTIFRLGRRVENLTATNQVCKNLMDTIRAPNFWDQGENSFDVRLVQLESACPEFINVAAMFSETCNSQIVGVQRVQNLGLWALFETKRLVMEQRGGANEMQLFHGANPKNFALINAKSFDRSLSAPGNFGKGPHFSRHASLCIKDSPSDASGVNHMYLARVLVGVSTPGTRGILSPPSRPDSDSLFDSTCDHKESDARAVFVTYNAAQAYPEYLVSFRKAASGPVRCQGAATTLPGPPSVPAGPPFPFPDRQASCKQQ